jgi:zinc/manganese transport system substrate-binding protein
MRLRIVSLFAAAALGVAACTGSGSSPVPTQPSIVVTTPILGAVVKDLVGDRAEVAVLMPNPSDPHQWSPSAKDIERVMNASLVVANGLALEEGLGAMLVEAEKSGVPVFRGGDHIQVREADGMADPHFWTDPISMREVVATLTAELDGLGIDVKVRGADLEQRLTDLDAEARDELAVVPEQDRKLVTGHVSLGYFADRYDFAVVGSVIPGLSSQGEVSAGELAQLKADIETQGVKIIFTEVGTSDAVIAAIGAETGVEVVRLALPILPDDGSYFTYVRNLATTVAGALR